MAIGCGSWGYSIQVYGTRWKRYVTCRCVRGLSFSVEGTFTKGLPFSSKLESKRERVSASAVYNFV